MVDQCLGIVFFPQPSRNTTSWDMVPWYPRLSTFLTCCVFSPLLCCIHNHLVVYSEENGEVGHPSRSPLWGYHGSLIPSSPLTLHWVVSCRSVSALRKSPQVQPALVCPIGTAYWFWGRLCFVVQWRRPLFSVFLCYVDALIVCLRSTLLSCFFRFSSSFLFVGSLFSTFLTVFSFFPLFFFSCFSWISSCLRTLNYTSETRPLHLLRLLIFLLLAIALLFLWPLLGRIVISLLFMRKDTALIFLLSSCKRPSPINCLRRCVGRLFPHNSADKQGENGLSRPTFPPFPSPCGVFCRTGWNSSVRFRLHHLGGEPHRQTMPPPY